MTEPVSCVSVAYRSAMCMLQWVKYFVDEVCHYMYITVFIVLYNNVYTGIEINY